MKQTDLCLSGSGTKLVAFVGALKYLDEQGYTFRHIIGNSGGALVGALLAAGYTPKELEQELESLPWQRFFDFNPKFWTGIFRGEYVYQYVKRKLDQKGIRTFKDLPGQLRIVATDITNKQVRVFGGAGDEQCEIAQACRFSMSIPLVFQCLKYDGAYMDDGLSLANYPIEYWDVLPDCDTIGLKIFDDGTLLPNQIYEGPNIIKRIISLYKARFSALLQAQEMRHVHDEDWHKRTIKINCAGFSPLAIPNAEDRLKLKVKGYLAAKEFICNLSSLS